MENGPTGLEIAIPGRRHPLILLFLGAWLVAWAFGEVVVAGELVSGKPGGSDLFVLVWLLMWTAGGAWALYTWLWTAVGKERISLHAGHLTIKRDLLGLGRSREYDLAHVSNLRVSTSSPADPFGWGASMRFWGMGEGIIAFDYGARTFRFGAGIDEAEAGQIVNELQSRHPFAGAAAAGKVQ